LESFSTVMMGFIDSSDRYRALIYDCAERCTVDALSAVAFLSCRLYGRKKFSQQPMPDR
jgi:hypothetical protein